MNAALEKLLNDLERTRFFGTVEIGYQNGIPGHAGVTRRYKFTTASEEQKPANLEHRGETNDRRENRNR